VGKINKLIFICFFSLILASNITFAQEQKIIVPAYFGPGTQWDTMLADPSVVDSVIVNNHGGPGASFDQSYKDAIDRAKGLGITIFGYVQTEYATRDQQAIFSDIDKYYSWYAVDGIFLDQGVRRGGNESYYQAIYNYIKSKGGFVILNTGTVPYESYMQYADAILTHENSFDFYINSYQPGTWVNENDSWSYWVSNYPPERFYHIIYATSQNQLQSAILASKTRNVYYIYITDEDSSSLGYVSYGTLPSYWSSEISSLGISRENAPPPATLPSETVVLGNETNETSEPPMNETAPQEEKGILEQLADSVTFVVNSFLEFLVNCFMKFQCLPTPSG